jgi:hypothetical protein
MKKYFTLFCFLFMTSISASSFAQDAAQSPAKSSINVDDVRQLGEQVKALKSLVSDDPKPEPKPEPKAEPAEQSKSMGDVADKALDMLGGAVGTVADTLKKIGPEVWRIMIIQQYANAARSLAGPLFALIASLIVFFAARKSLAIKEDERGYDHSDWRGFKRFLKGVTWFAPCLCALIVAINLSEAAAMLINPEYYALKDLLGLLTGK